MEILFHKKKNISQINLNKLKDKKEIIKKINTIDKKNLNYLNNLSGAKLINDESLSSLLNSIVYNLKHISSERSFNKEEIKSYRHTKYFSKFKIDNIMLIFYKSYPDNFYVCDFDLSDCKDEKFDLEEIGDILSQTYKKNTKYKYIFVSNDFNNYSEKDYIPSKNKNWINLETKNLKIKYVKKKIKIDIDEIEKIINIEQVEKDGRVILYSDKTIEKWKINFNSNLNYKQNIPLSGTLESLDGCITIYESKIDNIDVNISNGICEDSLNIVRSSGNINQINIKNSFKDGLDMDFSDIKINSIEIDNSGNDCVDMSFGNYNIFSLKLNSCKDNAVSIGEKSNLISNDLYAVNSLNALAVKDSSIVKLTSLYSKNNKFCFKLYNKKQEFLGGTLKLSNLFCDSKYVVEKNSNYKNNEL